MRILANLHTGLARRTPTSCRCAPHGGRSALRFGTAPRRGNPHARPEKEEKLQHPPQSHAHRTPPFAPCSGVRHAFALAISGSFGRSSAFWPESNDSPQAAFELPRARAAQTAEWAVHDVRAIERLAAVFPGVPSVLLHDSRCLPLRLAGAVCSFSRNTVSPRRACSASRRRDLFGAVPACSSTTEVPE